MANDRHTLAGAVLTELMLEIFRLNGRLLATGDRLVEDLGLTSARWQVLGAIHFAGEPQTVSWLARSMGLTRQAVQRVVNELEAEGLVTFVTNPAHRRAQHVVLSKAGHTAYRQADRRQIPWVNALASGLTHDEIERARDFLTGIRTRLEQEGL